MGMESMPNKGEDAFEKEKAAWELEMGNNEAARNEAGQKGREAREKLQGMRESTIATPETIALLKAEYDKWDREQLRLNAEEEALKRKRPW